MGSNEPINRVTFFNKGDDSMKQDSRSSLPQALVFGLFANVLVYGAVVYYLSIPLVLISADTKNCVRVIPEKSGSCDKLPGKYTIEWVK